jgi:hypothetical protein
MRIVFLSMSFLMASMMLTSSYAGNDGQLEKLKQTGVHHNGYQEGGSTRANLDLGLAKLKLYEDKTTSVSTGYLNRSIPVGNQSELEQVALSTWSDPYSSCNTIFRCNANLSTGWNDKTSIQFSTYNTNQTASHIIGRDVEVKQNESYHLVIHMKLNAWATFSHVVFEGFNGTTKRWYSIDDCPTYVLNGPLEWQEFSCGFTIEGNTTKVRPVLAAGWSSQLNREATTWFDSMNLIKFKPFLTDPNLEARVFYQGLNGPVSMAFLGPNDILVAEKSGTVQRIVNGSKLTKPLLHLGAARDGLLGIATDKNIQFTNIDSDKEAHFVFLYLTENNNAGNKTLANRVYR